VSLEAGQLSQLQALLKALVPQNKFYAPRVLRAGLTGTLSSLSEFFEKMPLTTKQELVADQSASPPYGTNLTYPLEYYTRFCQTSGTSRATGFSMRSRSGRSWASGRRSRRGSDSGVCACPVAE
jgi:phenylacetate-CoA ligase